MKEIKAIIQPFVANRVLAALREMSALPGATVSEVKGFGRDRALGRSGAADAAENFGVKKIKLEIFVADEVVREVIETIRKYAHTGNPGDGKIFVIAVDEAMSIRTGAAE